MSRPILVHVSNSKKYVMLILRIWYYTGLRINDEVAVEAEEDYNDVTEINIWAVNAQKRVM